MLEGCTKCGHLWEKRGKPDICPNCLSEDFDKLPILIRRKEMKYTHNEYPLAVVADAFDPPQDRKPGHHVTNLISEGLAISQGKRAEPYTEDSSGLMAMGRIWEAAAREWLREYVSYLGYTVQFPTRDEPLETECDGVLGNMDAMVISPTGPVAIVDMKFTTGNPVFTDKYQNMHQFKAYCYSEQVKDFWVLILSIPHKGRPEARFYVDQYSFAQEELDTTWKLITDAREYIEKTDI